MLTAAIPAVVSLPGCSRSTAPAPATQNPTLIVISGDTQGWIVPCGCTSNQSGGLLRRGSYLKNLRAANSVLYLDAGGAAFGNSAYQQEKLKSILLGEVALGISAHNLGGSEIAQGADVLRSLASATGIPFISANARARDGRPLAPAIRILSASGKRLAVIGVVSPKFAAADIDVDDPRQAIQTTLAQHRGEYDSLLILAYLPDNELRELAQSTPEADAVIGGPTGQSILPRQLGPTLLASATNKGKFLVQLTIQSPQWTGQIIELGPAYPDDPAQSDNLTAYLDDLRAHDFTADQSGYAPVLPIGAPADYRIAGNDSCIKCHADSGNIWLHSHHAHAGQTLQPRHFDVDPDCLRCHTTGFGLPGGFVSPRTTPNLYAVGCEDCHGPSQAHAANPIIHTQFTAFDQCIRCHDEENSPKFNLAAYWQIIQHGKHVSVPTTATTPS